MTTNVIAVISSFIDPHEDILGMLCDMQGYTIRVNTRKGKQTPLWTESHPEMDETELLGEEGHNAYKQLIGILQ